jgi:cytochrome c5
MKTSFIATAILFVIVLVAATAFSPAGNSGSTGPKGIPDSIFSIIDRSCTHCHVNDGNGMAKAHVNFDNWDTYDASKQAAKAALMCKELTKGKMPPKGFRSSNPDLVPTDAEVKKICDWANSLNP